MRLNNAIGSGSSVGLLFVDVQQDYLKKKLYPSQDRLLQNLAQLLSAFRSLGLPVIHCQTIVKPDGSNRMPHQKEQDIWRCIEGTAGSRSPKTLHPLENEKVFPKIFYSAFSNSELHTWLRKIEIDHLVIAGLYTHACVRESIIDAYTHGYKITVPGDAVASEHALHAQVSKEWLGNRACRIVSTDVVISDLRSKFGNEKRSTSAFKTSKTSSEKIFPVCFDTGEWKDLERNDFWEQKNPSNWKETLGFVPIGGRTDVERAVVSAEKSYKIWSQTPLQERLDILSNWMMELENRQESIVSLLALEVGKPVDTGRAEFRYGLSLMKEAIHRAGDEFSEETDSNVSIRYCPLGTVVLITPFNNPFAIPLGKIFPALVYGNSVVWKPALQSPRIVSLIVDAWKSTGFSEHCLHVVFGDATTAQTLASHIDVRAISFTGSIQSGRDLSVISSQFGKRLQAEMGGNNAVIICKTANASKVAKELVPEVYSFSGQRCTAPRRLIVAKEIFDEFTEAFMNAMDELKIGHPEQNDVQLGPLISKSHQDFIATLVEESSQEGGKLLKGGFIPDDFKSGCWFAPTLMTDVKSTSRLFQDESFGPVAVLSNAKNFNESIELCNAVTHGLSASLYSNDEKEIGIFLQKAEAGLLRINSKQAFFPPKASFNGWKASGSGIAEHGRWDREFYTRVQTIYK